MKSLRRGVLLKKYTTFRIGGPARYFCSIQNEEELVRAVDWAKDKGLPFFVLGGGSNLLVSDRGYNGLVIKIEESVQKRKGIALIQANCLSVWAGEKLSVVAEFAAEKGLTGLEWATGLPGTLGGAIKGNASAFGKSISDVLKEVRFIDVSDGVKPAVKCLAAGKCGFSCKKSLFTDNQNLIIVSALIVLKKGGKKDIKKIMSANLAYRKRNHPAEPSAGCIFRNQDFSKEKGKFKELVKKLPQAKKFNPSAVPASFLIDKAGLKGKRAGGAQISRKHANFIINTGNATAEDVLFLIKQVKKTVKKKFGIILTEEIRYLGF